MIFSKVASPNVPRKAKYRSRAKKPQVIYTPFPKLEEVFDIKTWDPAAVRPKRPMHSFMLFRTWQVRSRVREVQKKGREISRVISAEWANTDKEVKDHFERLAHLLKQLHNVVYPNYQYHNSPRNGNKGASAKVKGKGKGKGKGKKKGKVSRVEAEQDTANIDVAPDAPAANFDLIQGSHEQAQVEHIDWQRLFSTDVALDNQILENSSAATNWNTGVPVDGYLDYSLVVGPSNYNYQDDEMAQWYNYNWNTGMPVDGYPDYSSVDGPANYCDQDDGMTEWYNYSAQEEQGAIDFMLY